MRIDWEKFAASASIARPEGTTKAAASRHRTVSGLSEHPVARGALHTRTSSPRSQPLVRNMQLGTAEDQHETARVTRVPFGIR